MLICDNCHKDLPKNSFRISYSMNEAGRIQKIQIVHSACLNQHLMKVGFWSDLISLYKMPMPFDAKARIHSAILAFGGQVA